MSSTPHTRISIPRGDSPACQTIRDKWGWILAMGIYSTFDGWAAVALAMVAGAAKTERERSHAGAGGA